MLKKTFLIFFFLLNIVEYSHASVKDKIINNLIKTENLTFEFKQTINEKTEEGNCIIEYPKKIYCLYNNFNKKIMVSNGKSLIIKNTNGKGYYFYPLKRTPLEYLLDKEYLMSKIKTLEPKEVDNKYLSFSIFENNNRVNIFFDNKNLNLIGWQTEDIYQNLTITFISSVKINQPIDKKKFILPESN